MITTIILGIVGILVFLGGLYYLIAGAQDADSHKIHGATMVAGIIAAGVAALQWYGIF